MSKLSNYDVQKLQSNLEHISDNIRHENGKVDLNLSRTTFNDRESNEAIDFDLSENRSKLELLDSSISFNKNVENISTEDINLEEYENGSNDVTNDSDSLEESTGQHSYVNSKNYPDNFPLESGQVDPKFTKADYNCPNSIESDNFSLIKNKSKLETYKSSVSFNGDIGDINDESIYDENLEGIVERVYKKTFVVDLFDIDDTYQIPKYHAELPISELTEKEKCQLTVGSKVLVKLGKYFSNNEEKLIYKAYLVPNPPISESDIKEAFKKAYEILGGTYEHETP